MTYRPMNSNDDDLQVPDTNYEQFEEVHNINESPLSLLEPTLDYDEDVQDISEAVSEFDGAPEQEDRGMSVVVEVEKAGNHPVNPVDSIPEDIVEEPVLDMREPSADDNVSFLLSNVRYLMTPQICQTRNDTISSDLPTKRKRIRRAMELNGCYCGNVLSSSMAGVVECKRTGCETQWVSRILLFIGLNLLHNYSQYHLECITDDPISKNWVCDACKASGEGRGGKRSRR